MQRPCNIGILWPAVSAFAVLFFSASFPPEAGAAPARPAPGKMRVVVNATETGGASQRTLPCAGRIYAHITFPDDFAGKHVVVGLWIKPNGEVQERTEIAVDFPPRGAKTAILWLAFDEENKTIFDEFTFGGDYGARRNPFDGVWTLKIEGDGKPLARSSFKVVCG